MGDEMIRLTSDGVEEDDSEEDEIYYEPIFDDDRQYSGLLEDE